MSGSKVRTLYVDLGTDQYQRLLAGPPGNLALKAGLVTLPPGASVGRHSTEGYEELLVVLSGAGEMVTEDGTRTPIDVSRFCYCPPHTGHDVINSGKETLRYVYIVTRTE